MVGERAARGDDGKTYYVPADMTYKEWKKSFVQEKSDVFNRFTNNIKNRMNSHKPVSFMSLDDEYKDELLGVISNSSTTIQKIMDKYEDKIMFVNEKHEGAAYTSAKGISVNLSTDGANRRGAWTSTFHEIDHSIDRVSNRISQSYPAFRKI